MTLSIFSLLLSYVPKVSFLISFHLLFFFFFLIFLNYILFIKLQLLVQHSVYFLNSWYCSVWCQPIDGDRVDMIILADPWLLWRSEWSMVEKGASDSAAYTYGVWCWYLWRRSQYPTYLPSGRHMMSLQLGIVADYVAGDMYYTLG